MTSCESLATAGRVAYWPPWALLRSKWLPATLTAQALAACADAPPRGRHMRTHANRVRTVAWRRPGATTKETGKTNHLYTQGPVPSARCRRIRRRTCTCWRRCRHWCCCGAGTGCRRRRWGCCRCRRDMLVLYFHVAHGGIDALRHRTHYGVSHAPRQAGRARRRTRARRRAMLRCECPRRAERAGGSALCRRVRAGRARCSAETPQGGARPALARPSTPARPLLGPTRSWHEPVHTPPQLFPYVPGAQEHEHPASSGEKRSVVGCPPPTAR